MIFRGLIIPVFDSVSHSVTLKTAGAQSRRRKIVMKQQPFWKRQSMQEVFKFSFYLFIPVAASVFYANPAFMHDYSKWYYVFSCHISCFILCLVRKSSWISYPKSDSVYTIPVGEEIEKYRERIKRLS